MKLRSGSEVGGQIRDGLIQALLAFSMAWTPVALARDFSGKYQSSAPNDYVYLEIVGPGNQSAKNFFVADGGVVAGMKDLYALTVSGNVLDFRSTGCVTSYDPGTENPSTECKLAKDEVPDVQAAPMFVAPEIHCIAALDGKTLKCTFHWPQGLVEHYVLHSVSRFTYPESDGRPVRPCDCRD